MKVVLDTNVLVSGLIWQGIPRRIYDALKSGQFVLVVSSHILDEYRRVLRRLSQHHTIVDTDAVVESLNVKALMTDPKPFARQICTDKDDDIFIEAATDAYADYIVTGDRALLKVKHFRGTEIVTARQFVSKL